MVKRIPVLDTILYSTDEIYQAILPAHFDQKLVKLFRIIVQSML